MDDRIAKATEKFRQDHFNAWLNHASDAEKLEAGYLIAKELDRPGLGSLRDYINRLIDQRDQRTQTAPRR